MIKYLSDQLVHSHYGNVRVQVAQPRDLALLGQQNRHAQVAQQGGHTHLGSDEEPGGHVQVAQPGGNAQSSYIDQGTYLAI
jgi:hypothetical protein